MKIAWVKRKSHQAGASLLEVLAAIAISAGLMAAGANYIQDRLTDVKNQAASQYQVTVTDAAKKAIKANYAAYAASATAAVPVVITVPNLIAAGYLNTGFSSTNPYGQTACVLLIKPSGNQLQALVVTETTATAQKIPDATIALTAAQGGAQGGYVPTTDPVNVYGAYGAWKIPIAPFNTKNCSGTAFASGSLAYSIFFDSDAMSNDFLYRNQIAGHPELNTMNTPLNMGSVQTLGVACSPNGAIAADNTGAVLSCKSGVWSLQGSLYWKDAVANVASLPACNATSYGQTRVAMNPSVGSGARAYTCNGGAWVALAVDDSGNLTAPGVMFAQRYYDSNNSGYYVDPDSMSNMRTTAIDDIYLNSKGAWLSTLIPKFLLMATYQIGPWNAYVPKPSCPNGFTPRIIVTPQRFNIPRHDPSYNDTWSTMRAYAYDYGGYWYAYVDVIEFMNGWGGRITAVDNSGGYAPWAYGGAVNGIAQAYCGI